MASPQLENGHTQIANELLDAFCHASPGGASAQVLWAIIRRTYGWKKKEDSISISQLEEMTSLCRRSVIYALQNLEAQNFITIQRLRGRGNVNQINTVAIQKNYELWVVQTKSPQWQKQLQNKREKYHDEVVQRKIRGSAENRQTLAKKGSAEKRGSAENGKGVVQRNDATMQFSAPTKDNIQKKNIQKKEHGEFHNVLLTDEEYQKLKDKFPADFASRIQRLSSYMESKGRKYKSHYATILTWARSDSDGRTGKARNPRELPKTYTDSPEYEDLQ